MQGKNRQIYNWKQYEIWGSHGAEDVNYGRIGTKPCELVGIQYVSPKRLLSRRPTSTTGDNTYEEWYYKLPKVTETEE
jgi:hypothetical protein